MEWDLFSILLSICEIKTTDPQRCKGRPHQQLLEEASPAKPRAAQVVLFSPLMSGCLQVVVAGGKTCETEGTCFGLVRVGDRRRPRVSVCVSPAAAGPCWRGGPAGAWVARSACV